VETKIIKVLEQSPQGMHDPKYTYHILIGQIISDKQFRGGYIRDKEGI